MTTHTPNHAPQPAVQPELTTEEQAIFSLAAVEAWREYRQGLVNDQLASLAGQGQFVSENMMESFGLTADVAIDQYLADQGLDTSSPNYSEIRENFILAGRISNDAWEHSASSRGEQGDAPSGRDVFAQLVAERINQNNTAPNAPQTPNNAERTPEEWEEFAAGYEEYAGLLTDVHVSREAWATASAKRQGRAFSMKDGKRDEIRDNYHAKVQALGIMELESQISDNDDDTTKNAKVIEYLFKEQARLRELTTEKLQGTKVGRFVKFMNKGNLGVRLAKGFGVGLVVGAGGALLLGAAGAAGGAALAIGASRFVKGYSSNDRHRGMKTAEEEFGNGNPVELANSDGDSIEERFRAASEVYNESFEDATQEEQQKRRKALAWGVGSVALGAGAGYALSNIGELSSIKDSIYDKIFGAPPDTDNTPQGVEDDKERLFGPDGDRDGDGTINSEDMDKDGDGVRNSKDFAPLNPEVQTDPNAPDWSEIPHDARWVEPGEGWYQTFEELGIPQDNWADTLETAGPELQNQGWAYYDEANNEWRISQPGRLPNESLQVIADAAKRDGFTLAA